MRPRPAAPGSTYGFGTLGLREIVSLIHPHNLRSTAVAERLGLELRERVPHPQHPVDVCVYSTVARGGGSLTKTSRPAGRPV